MTPESKIKKKITDLLRSYGKACYYFMPVPTGYGKRSLDYLGCLRGWFFAIEAKAPGGTPTVKQEATLEDIRHADGFTFVVYDEDTLTVLKTTLDVLYHGREPDPAEYNDYGRQRVRHRRRAPPRS